MKKINVVLLHPPLTIEERYGDSKSYSGHIHPPQGLCHLAAMFPENKYSISIIDAQALFINVEETAPGHYYWPDLDVDLTDETIEHPERFPLVSVPRE